MFDLLRPSHRGPRFRTLLLVVGALVLLGFSPAQADPERAMRADYPQAIRYNRAYLRQFIYDTSVMPRWIGKTDSFWYSYRTSQGTNYYRVNPKLPSKEPLFDRAKLAALLSELVQKPLDPATLPLSRVTVNDEATKLKFVTDGFQFEYDLAAEKLSKLGKAPPAPAGIPGMSDGQRRLEELDEQQRRQMEEMMEQRQQQLEEQQRREQDLDEQQREQLRQQRQEQMRRQMGQGPLRGFTPDYRAFSPDRKTYVFARKHNLYLVTAGKITMQDLVFPAWQPDLLGTLGQLSAVKVGLERSSPDHSAVQLTMDGIEDYSFGGGNDDRKVRPSVQWSKDSKAFYVTRMDSRGVKELFLVNSIANPRPTLEKYKYAMPGEEAIRKTELFVCEPATKKLVRVKPKWKDESYTNLHWGKASDELRFVRRDRLLRHLEFCSVNIHTGETQCLLTEGFENAFIDPQPVRYIDETDEMIWWSERSGWGHFYLYDRKGKLKNVITSGLYRASRIVAVDPQKRLLYFQGNGREAGENVYLSHLYSVHLDGTGLTLLDPGNAFHQSSLSPTRQFVVDNCSRVDLAPVAVLRDANGKQIMELERADLSRLYEAGWKMPETFTVKAADGVTDLYGNMWKPFNMQPNKKYPIIAHVYPGPQTEGVTHTFSASSDNQQLAQLGFIVVQVGHRGGTPTRSKAYHSHGYFNMRDYGLADKKAAIEQLAARHSFIDIDKVGIYGHSGGGFMSAAALLQKPYNEFFKAAVASAGNHDNNIYNNSWAERYHGLREVAVKKDDGKTRTLQVDTAGSGRGGDSGSQDENGQGKSDQQDVKKEDQDDKTQKDGGLTKDMQKEKPPTDTRFEIKVPTNAELAANLKGALLLVHGEIDNNVHPANTMRLVDALIKANKRFDMLILPGKRHGFADYQPYFTQRMWEFFAEHLLGDRQTGADIYEKGR